MTIIEALDDPALFKGQFRGGTWGAWRSFLRALFALPMDDADLATYRHHTGRTEPPSEPFREATVIAGRRSGKSRTMGLLAVWYACFQDHAAKLASGETAVVSVISSDRKQSRVIFDYVAGFLRDTPLLSAMVEEEAAESITLNNRVRIEITTASFRTARGFSYAAVIMDELAFMRDGESSANPAGEIQRAVLPGLATLDGTLLKCSSPYSRRGLLWDDFRRFYGRGDAPVLLWKGASRELNPSLPQRVVDRAMEDDPDGAQAEWLGEFRRDVADFVSREVIDQCTALGRHELPRISANTYVAFVDPAGGSGADAMTLAVAHAEGKGDVVRAVLDCTRERMPPFSPDQTVADFAAVLKSYGVSRVVGDRYGGEWCREQFRKHGITYDLADKPKSDIYRDALPLLNSGRAELLDVPKLAAQLSGLERRTARGGRDSIDHAPNAHDDLANAVAGALLLCDKPCSGYNLMRAMGLADDGTPLPGIDARGFFIPGHTSRDG